MATEPTFQTPEPCSGQFSRLLGGDDLPAPPLAPRGLRPLAFSGVAAIGNNLSLGYDQCETSQLPIGCERERSNSARDDSSHTVPPFAAVTDERRIDNFLDCYEGRTKMRTTFLVSLSHLKEAELDMLRKFKLNLDYKDGFRLRVNWVQFARLLRMNLVKETIDVPDNFWPVVKMAFEQTAAMEDLA